MFINSIISPDLAFFYSNYNNWLSYLKVSIKSSLSITNLFGYCIKLILKPTFLQDIDWVIILNKLEMDYLVKGSD